MDTDVIPRGCIVATLGPGTKHTTTLFHLGVCLMGDEIMPAANYAVQQQRNHPILCTNMSSDYLDLQRR